MEFKLQNKIESITDEEVNESQLQSIINEFYPTINILPTEHNQFEGIKEYCNLIESNSWELIHYIEKEIHNLTEDIEQEIQIIDNNLPKLTLDLNLIKYKIESLKAKILECETEMKIDNAINKITENSYYTELIQLTTEQKDIENKIEELNLDAFWNNLEKEIILALEQKNYIVASKKYKQAELNLENQLKINNQEKQDSRKKVLNLCLQRIESVYRQVLTEGIKNRDKLVTKNLLTGYSVLGNEDKVYNKIIKEFCFSIVVNFKSEYNKGIETSDMKINLLKKYLNDILEKINEEIEWCLLVFEKEVYKLITKLIVNFLNHLKSYFFQNEENEIMLSYFNLINEFLIKIERVIYFHCVKYSNENKKEMENMEDEEDNLLTISQFKCSTLFEYWLLNLVPILSMFLKYQQEYYNQNNKYILFSIEFGRELIKKDKKFTFGYNLLGLLNYIQNIIKNTLNQINNNSNNQLQQSTIVNWNRIQELIKMNEKFLNIQKEFTQLIEEMNLEYNYLTIINDLDINNMKLEDYEMILDNNNNNNNNNNSNNNNNNNNPIKVALATIKNCQQSEIMNNKEFKQIIEMIKLNKFNEIKVNQDIYNQINNEIQLISKQLFELVSCPILLKIDNMSEKNNNEKNGNESNLFSLAPNRNILEIGEYLLTLPQRLEVYLDDLGFLVTQKYFNNNNNNNQNKQKVLNQWINELSQLTMSYYYQRITVNYIKLEQLKIDCSYLLNVIMALSINPILDLKLLLIALNLNYNQLILLIKNIQFNENIYTNESYLKVLNLLSDQFKEFNLIDILNNNDKDKDKDKDKNKDTNIITTNYTSNQIHDIVINILKSINQLK